MKGPVTVQKAAFPRRNFLLGLLKKHFTVLRLPPPVIFSAVLPFRRRLLHPVKERPEKKVFEAVNPYLLPLL